MEAKEKECKNCGNKFRPFTSLQKYCRAECMREGEKVRQDQKKEVKKQKKLSERILKLEAAQIVFNSYIRERDKGKECICCGKPLTGHYHAGHYFSQGGHSAVRFNEDNVHGQHVTCNIEYNHKLLAGFGENVERRIGAHRMELLRAEAYELKKWEIHELDSIIREYRRKLVELKACN